jgi:transcriptional regulator with XRE-family HTH domain
VLTYLDIAKELGISRGTLSRKFARYNAEASGKGLKAIAPDEERPTKTTLHLFNPERLEEIKQAIASVVPKKSGRKAKIKN